MNNSPTITIKKRSDKFLDYQLKQINLISYWSGLPTENIKDLVEEFHPVPLVYSFNPNK